MSDPRPQGGNEDAGEGGVVVNPKILPEIIETIQNVFEGIPYSQCYVGITADYERRLFEDHRVSKLRDRWFVVRAASYIVAREVEKFFLDAGMDGVPGGGDETTTIVYAYRKGRFTEP